MNSRLSLPKVSFLIGLSLCLWNCSKEEIFDDATGRLAGTYDVKTYIINGDTLMGTGSDRLGLRLFSIKIFRKSADSVNLFFQSQRYGQVASAIYYKSAALQDQGDGTQRLIYSRHQNTEYEALISDKIFREHYPVLNGTYLVLPENYVPQTPTDSTLAGITIIAEKRAE